MVIFETKAFTRQIKELLDDGEYRELQNTLISDPTAGAQIPGCGGIRKLRWQAKGHGKRGGARIIYYWFVSSDKIGMLAAYPKNQQADLTAGQKKILKMIVTEELKNA